MYTIADLFKMQDTLNKRVGLDSGAFQALFRDGKIVAEGSEEYKAALAHAGKWIDDLLKAMSNEMEELRNCTYWKHWCKEAQDGRRYEIKNVEAARKEVIDMLHFWISFAQVLGMSPEMVCGMYGSKLENNIKRQDDGYSIEVKDKAWALFLEYPDINTDLGSLTGESLEDLPEAAQEFYRTWAGITLGAATGQASNCVGVGGCKYCGQRGCTVRRYLSTLPGTRYCECLDEKFNDGPKEDAASILPQPDPDCKKCGGDGYVR